MDINRKHKKNSYKIDRDDEKEGFLEMKIFAEKLVDKTLKKAVKVVEKDKVKWISCKKLKCPCYPPDEKGEGSMVTNIKWPISEEFTVQNGKAKIKEFVLQWKLEDDWLFCIDFRGSQKDTCSEYFLYEVKWSIPTKTYPIPQATASVFFEIEVCSVVPRNLPIKVRYIFEGNRYQHIPQRIDFQEKFLMNIIDNKLKLFKKIAF